MADPSPTDAEPEGQTPPPDEGQKPADGGEATPEAQEGQGKSYSEAYVRQLRREAAEQRKRLAELEEPAQEREDAEKTEQQRLVDRLAKLEKRAVDAEAKLLRLEVAREHGLDMTAASFLTGN